MFRCCLGCVWVLFGNWLGVAWVLFAWCLGVAWVLSGRRLGVDFGRIDRLPLRCTLSHVSA
eukprot:11194143-Lingulodinium_polyedra.AAC.1